MSAACRCASSDMRAWRDMIGTVMQDDQLFAGSIADNIAFFDARPDAAWVERCARIAAVHDEIEAMPMGYHTLIGDMGASISGGQKQRILLARALYKRPKILFLDEATSALDVEREREVNQAIRQLDLTRVIVAHRPETIASAGRVIVLGEGRVDAGPAQRDRRRGQFRTCAEAGGAARRRLPRMIVLGIESSCDETGVALVQSRRAAARRCCLRRRCTPRSTCTRPTAAWCPSWPRATTSGGSCRSLRQVAARGSGRRSPQIDVVAYTQGPGLAGRAARRGRRRECARHCARQAGAGRAPPRRAPAVAVPLGRCAASFRSSRCSSPAATRS